MDKSRLQAFLAKEECDETISELKGVLRKTEYDVSLQKYLLHHIPRDKESFLKCVLTWANTHKDVKYVWELVMLLIDEDKQERPSTIIQGLQIDQEQNAGVVHHDGQRETLLARVVRAKLPDLAKHHGSSNENILHAACQRGTSRALATIIQEISKRKNGSSLLTGLVQDAKPVTENKNKPYTPLEVALHQGSADMIKILAGHEDGFLTNHFYNEATDGNLENLRALVEGAGKDATASILTPKLLQAAIGRDTTRRHMRYFEMWDFIISNKKELGNEPGLLKLAIENGHFEIVKSLLDNYKSHLTDSLQIVSDAAQLAVDLVLKTLEAKRDLEDRLAERPQGNITKRASPKETAAETQEAASNGRTESKGEETTVQAWEKVTAGGDDDEPSEDEAGYSTSEEGSDDESSDDENNEDPKSEKLAELERAITNSANIRDVLLDTMVRTLSPRDTRACWPKERSELSFQFLSLRNVVAPPLLSITNPS
jgi:hypothetical protein